MHIRRYGILFPNFHSFLNFFFCWHTAQHETSGSLDLLRVRSTEHHETTFRNPDLADWHPSLGLPGGVRPCPW